MPIAKEPESNYEPAPEGLHQAVCCDVWEQWTEEKREDWGGGLVEKTRICWEIAEVNPKTGRPYDVSQKYTLSLHEKSNLRKHLEAWRGKKFTTAELKGFDLEVLVGVNCQLQVLHNESEGKVYANIQAIVPLGKTTPKIVVSKEYKRKKVRDAEKAKAEAAEKGHAAPSVDESGYDHREAEYAAAEPGDDVPFSLVGLLPVLLPAALSFLALGGVA